MAQTLTLLPSGAGELLERWNDDLDALAREKNVEALKYEQAAYAQMAVESLTTGGSRTAPHFAALSKRAGELADQIEHAPRLLVRAPEVTEGLVELDG